MKPHPAQDKPELDGPELQANWSYWGLTMPTTVTCFEANGTKANVYESKPSRGVKPAKDMEITNIKPF